MAANIDILIRALDQASGPIGKVEDSLGDLDKTGDNSQRKLGKLGSAMGSGLKIAAGIGVGAIAGVAAGIAKIGVEAFNVSRDTEQAAGDIAASLGLPIEAAEEFAKVARQVYGNNFAESVTDAGEAVAFLTQQMRLSADDPSLQKLTEQAFALEDSFDVGVTESVDAAKTLMDNFGVTGQEAFDLITAGFQKGLNRSGDFIDTIGEYSTQFAGAGADAAQFFGFLKTGLQGGVLGTDKAADAFKEFSIRVIDGSKNTRWALEQVTGASLDFEASVSSGEKTVHEAFGEILMEIGKIEDPLQQQAVGVALLGTQFEDLGIDAVLGLELIGDEFDDLAGQTDTLNAQYTSFGQVWGALWRKTIVAITPLTDKLLDLANRAMPHVERAFDFIQRLLNGELIPSINRTRDQFGVLGKWFFDNMPLIRETVHTVLEAIRGFWERNGAVIMQVVQNTFNTVKIVIETVLLTILDLFKVIMQVITGDWEGAWQTILGIVDRIWNTIVSVILNQLDSLITIFRNIDWAGLGRSIIEGIANGISSAAGAIADAARRAARNALDAAKRALGIGSPSMAAAMEVGIPFAEGVGLGIERGLQQLGMNLSGGLASMTAGAAGAGGPISVNVNQNFAGAADAGMVGGAASQGVLSGLRKAGRR
jgi:hypothetical protein